MGYDATVVANVNGELPTQLTLAGTDFPTATPRLE